MQYIILDMEWNQPWPGSYSAKKALPSPLRGVVSCGPFNLPSGKVYPLRRSISSNTRRSRPGKNGSAPSAAVKSIRVRAAQVTV